MRTINVHGDDILLDVDCRRLEGTAPALREHNAAILDAAMVERAAQALFEFVFATSRRLDSKHLWVNCEEETKLGFRREAEAVLQAVFSHLH